MTPYAEGWRPIRRPQPAPGRLDPETAKAGASQCREALAKGRSDG